MTDAIPVVLVHGAMHGAWCWDAVGTELDDLGVPHVEVELPGHGARHAEAKEASMLSYAAAVLDAIDAMGRPVVLVGHSMSGQVVARAATARPGRVARLVLLNAQVLRDGATNLGTLSADKQAQYRRLTERQGGVAYRLDDDEIYGRWLQDLPRDDPRVQRVLRLVTPQPFAPLVEPAIDQDFAACGVPATYVRSTADVGSPPQRVQRFIEALPAGTDVVLVPGGHDCMISEPAAVAAVIARLAVIAAASSPQPAPDGAVA